MLARFAFITLAGAALCGRPMAQVAPLLLTEICVTPSAGEFVEIYNPGPGAVDLTDYYLTDATFVGGGTYYYQIVLGGAGIGGGGRFNDFYARFPAGTQLEPNAYLTVACSGSDAYFATYGTLPDVELWDDNGLADGVPQMLEATMGSINGQGGLTDSGEMLVLLAWDGLSDRVTDCDYAVWGDKVEAVDKTGIALDGPDADSVATAYAPERSIAAQVPVAGDADGNHPAGQSWQRRSLSEGREIRSGGNGARGHDETSENQDYTWVQADVTPGGPAVGSVACGLTTDTVSGESTLTISGATPGGVLLVVFSLGEAGINLGPCPGESLAVTIPGLLSFVNADSGGSRTASGTVNVGSGELGVQVVDATSCVVSNPVFDVF